jgi:hypothetical protein
MRKIFLFFLIFSFFCTAQADSKKTILLIKGQRSDATGLIENIAHAIEKQVSSKYLVKVANGSPSKKPAFIVNLDMETSIVDYGPIKQLRVTYEYHVKNAFLNLVLIRKSGIRKFAAQSNEEVMEKGTSFFAQKILRQMKKKF